MKCLTKPIFSLVFLFLTTCSVVAQDAVQVEIEAVDAGGKSISVKHNGKSRKLSLAPNVEITIDGKKTILASLMPGSTVSVTYDKGISVVTSIAAQRNAILPAEPLAEGWDQIDDRLIFLMVRLASTEASLEAIDDALAASNRSQSRKNSQARQAENKNVDMDRKGGGPVKWQLFYGRTAESFFYHPTDRNSTYHTVTILSQQAPANDNQTGPGVPSRQGLPVHQRPPQFDYIYRANESAKARAEKEIATLVGKTAELTERKHRLEAEQAGLWCEIAFRSVSHYDLDKKPLYRFEPLLRNASDTDSRVQFETARSAASFMALALSIVDAAQKDQQGTFSKIKPAISKARQDLNDVWLRIGVDVTDRKSIEGRFNALAKKLEESASNLSDSYMVAMEGDRAKDQQRKDTFRGLLQESIIRYAEIILALDEMATLMKDDWTIKPDIDKPIKFVGLESIQVAKERSGILEPSPPNSPVASQSIVGLWQTKDGTESKRFSDDGTLVEMNQLGSVFNSGKWQLSENSSYRAKLKNGWSISIEVIGPSDATFKVFDRENRFVEKKEMVRVNGAIDPFQQSSVWVSQDIKLIVLDRNAEKFRAKLESNEWERILNGTIGNNKVTWLAKDVQPVKGGTGGDNFGTISKDELGVVASI